MSSTVFIRLRVTLMSLLLLPVLAMTCGCLSTRWKCDVTALDPSITVENDLVVLGKCRWAAVSSDRAAEPVWLDSYGAKLRDELLKLGAAAQSMDKRLILDADVRCWKRIDSDVLIAALFLLTVFTLPGQSVVESVYEAHLELRDESGNVVFEEIVPLFSHVQETWVSVFSPLALLPALFSSEYGAWNTDVPYDQPVIAAQLIAERINSEEVRTACAKYWQQRELMLVERPREFPRPTVSWTPLTATEVVAVSPRRPVARRPLTVRPDALGQTYALLIGVDDFEDPAINDLEYSEADAHQVAETLVEIGAVSADHIMHFGGSAGDGKQLATRRNVLTALAYFADALKPEDILIFYYSGHGVTDPEGRQCLLAQNTPLAIAFDEGIPLERLYYYLDSCQAQRQVVVLDMCHAGGAERVRGVGGVSSEASNLMEGLHGFAQGLEGRIVFAATGAGGVSYESDEHGLGVFTHYLVAGLRGAAASTRKPEDVTMYDLSVYVQESVRKWCFDAMRVPAQEPDVRLEKTVGEMVLARHPRRQKQDVEEP